MRPNLVIIGLMLLVLVGSFSSCTKTESVVLPQKTLNLISTQDASIYLGDVAASGAAVSDNGSGSSDLLRIGYNNEQKCFVRSLVTFDISSLPANAVIESAILSFTVGKSGDRLGGVDVYKLTQTWAEGTTDDNCYYYNTCSAAGAAVTSGGDVTWNSTSNGGTAWTTAGGSFVSTPSASVANAGMASFSSQGLIDDINAWIKTPTTNFGWILKVDETIVTKSGGEQVRYYGREASTNKATRSANWVNGADATTKPTLTITYHQ